MKTDSGYVLKNSDELYFIGLNHADKQLRKAKIYHSEKWARDAAEEINSNNHRLLGVKHDFDLVRVEITEVESEDVK